MCIQTLVKAFAIASTPSFLRNVLESLVVCVDHYQRAVCGRRSLSPRGGEIPAIYTYIASSSFSRAALSLSLVRLISSCVLPRCLFAAQRVIAIGVSKLNVMVML